MPALIPRACRKRGCLAQPLTAQVIVPHLNEGWQQHQRGQSRHQRGYGSNGTGCAQSFSTETNTFVRNACEMEGIHPLRR